MKALYLIAASAAALSVAACYPAPKRLTRLDCPEAQGALTRIGQAADGRSCAYVSENGAEVSLRIVEVEGGLEATLARLEQELRSYIPPQTAAAPTSADGVENAEAPAETAAASAEADTASGWAGAAAAAQKASAEARADAGGRLNVEVSGDEGAEVVRVDIPGIRIEADEANDEANIQIGKMTIQASDQGATMRTRKDVRLRGEALSREKRGVRARLVIAGDQVEPAWRYLEYEVGGRKTGPLAVALVRAKEGDGMGHDHSDVERLVRRNGGV
ncbi:hypothetical protein ACFODL_09900 [Phenylobacterium terrae]|uniref:Auto-transporter adhesin head GIN domain-containing protein n=1 Tax=Phenylobacterium terrae TaxID=2665495 RepID=A0ABW4N668_9CAUL